MHLPEVADTHLKHGCLMLFLDFQHRQGQAYFIVKIPCGFQYIIFCLQYRSNELLRTRFPHTSRNPDYRKRKVLPIKTCNILQRLKRIFHQNESSRPLIRLLFTDHPCCPFRKNLADKAMPVYFLPFCCNKKITLFYLTGIQHYPGHFLILLRIIVI